MVIDNIAKKVGVKVNKRQFKSKTAVANIGGEKVILVKPQTYMNLSGEAVVEVLKFYKLSSQDLLVIYDDIDVELGKIKIRKHGRPGTHNGMKNIVQNVQTEEFPRIRVGIGKPDNNEDLKDFVLQKLDENEKKIIENASDVIYNALVEIMTHGIESAMNLYNRHKDGEYGNEWINDK